ncbi:hypothetical protein [Phytoactinopolyspora halotolerans]|uniref:Uncharacterized protein n=1 Tax=Phytoactinopolyspora halotolerans TaxID=1981512 RepID=A0A6L9S566_9ACTN|nr:hypothetical protein [Phytoactinopolyspora halotolerans]NEE00133.1 hypothetical protein [Phytoactinopolyspora halotolerans]
MNVVEFVVQSQELGAGTRPVVNLLVDGTHLQEQARAVELPYARREGNPGLAGNYAGLIADDGLPASHYLGEPVETWFDDHDTILLGCTCGDPGCWPLTARVEVSDTTVAWSGFRNGHRDWDLADLGPFVFDRADYEEALARIHLG